MTDQDHGGVSAAPSIRLDGCKRLAAGSEKAVYLHPDQPHLIVKVRQFRRYKAHAQQSWLHRFLLRHSEIHRLAWLLREVETSVILLNREHRPDVPLPVALYQGLEMTDIGPAVIAARVSLPKHPLGLSLAHLHKKGQLDPTHVAALNVFVTRIMAWRVPITDLDPANLVYGSRGNAPEFVLVDGFGDYSALRIRIRLPASNDWINRKKFRMLAARIGLAWDDVALTFAFPTDDGAAQRGDTT